MSRLLLILSPGLVALCTIAPSTPIQVPVTARAIPIPWLPASVTGGFATAVPPVAIAAAVEVVVPACVANPITKLDVHPLDFPRWFLPWRRRLPGLLRLWRSLLFLILFLLPLFLILLLILLLLFLILMLLLLLLLLMLILFRLLLLLLLLLLRLRWAWGLS